LKFRKIFGRCFYGPPCVMSKTSCARLVGDNAY
jgi:hypothetical protein